MKLAISIDVEEEGLFSGKYPRTPPGVSNVAQLKRLEFIPREFGIPLTLLVTYQVARDPGAQEILKYWQERYGAEIGAHLHPWNTSPFIDLPDPEPVRSEKMPISLIRDKLHNLVSAIKEGLGVTPRSFRMGRFDWGPKLRSLLPEMGIRVDSSMVPCTQKVGGPDYFLTPADPFPLAVSEGAGDTLWEAPLTMVPVLPGTASWVYRFSSLFAGARGQRLRSWFPHVLAAGIHPVWFPLPSMRLAVRLHRRRGGQVLNMFLHSTELAPGGTPQFPTEAAVARLIRKMRSFFTWLKKTGPVQGVRLSDFYNREGPAAG
ncbi:MAG: hypothetical protein PHU44_16195 [Syntrophales bacterium]|nr:hypothetical protein [Syntrophales bacterium]MDD5643026.1 hypothetical protein [Syntrophales bacterium]